MYIRPLLIRGKKPVSAVPFCRMGSLAGKLANVRWSLCEPGQQKDLVLDALEPMYRTSLATTYYQHIAFINLNDEEASFHDREPRQV